MLGRLRNMTSLYLMRGDQILLLFRQGGRVVNHVWTGSAGGHFEESELNDAKGCVLRELEEELGLNENHLRGLELKYITLRRTKGEIRQNYYFFARLDETAPKQLRSNEGQLRWFPMEEIFSLKMPYTAGYVMEHYCRIGQFSDKMYAGIATEDGVEFTELVEF